MTLFANVPITSEPSIAINTERALLAAGITTIGDAAALTEREARGPRVALSAQPTPRSGRRNHDHD